MPPHTLPSLLVVSLAAGLAPLLTVPTTPSPAAPSPAAPAGPGFRPAPALSGVAPAPERIRVEQVVEAAPADVFRAWTVEAEVERWFAPAARVELRPGGPYEISFDPAAGTGRTGSEGCRVLAWVDDEMLSFSWNAPPKFGVLRGLHSFVVVRLHPVEGGEAGPATRVELIHDGFAPAEGMQAVRTYFAAAWPRVLANLAAHLAAGGAGDARTPEPVRAPEPRSPRAEKTYAIFLSPADVESVMKPNRAQLQAFGGHVAHIQRLWANGRLLAAGPCTGEVMFPESRERRLVGLPELPGIVLFRAVDDADARSVMEQDPLVEAGILRACVVEWSPAFVGQ